MPANALLVIDFDGVIANGAEECALITWYADRTPEGTEDGPALLRAVPGRFRSEFDRLRSYARRLEHFAVTLHPDAPAITSQQQFDDVFAGLPDGRAAQFAAAATTLRTRLRQEQRQFWCSAHPLYPGIEALLERYSGRTHVLTAKDSASTWEILAWHRLDRHVSRVWGESTAKAATVRELLRDRDTPGTPDLVFLDDNLANVRSVAEIGAGVQARWAIWGWHSPEHRELARQNGVPAVRLDPRGQLVVQPWEA